MDTILVDPIWFQYGLGCTNMERVPIWIFAMANMALIWLIWTQYGSIWIQYGSNMVVHIGSILDPYWGLNMDPIWIQYGKVTPIWIANMVQYGSNMAHYASAIQTVTILYTILYNMYNIVQYTSILYNTVVNIVHIAQYCNVLYNIVFWQIVLGWLSFVIGTMPSPTRSRKCFPKN
jgi:hypothetical protein